MNTHSFFDELQKIASQLEPPMPEISDPHSYEGDDNYITKDRLKRLGKASLAMGIGGGLGGALGLAVGRKLRSPWGVRRALNAPDWLLEYGPMAVGVLGGAGAMIPLLKDPKRYIKYGDKPK